MARVEGISKLRRKLEEFPKSARFEIERALIKGANEMVRMAKGLAPTRTGALRDSIQWNFPENVPAYAAFVDRARFKRGPNDLSIVVTAGAAGTRAEGGVRYAHLVEFGTPPHLNRGLFPGTRHPGTSAQPFFFPAYRAVKSRTKRRVSRAISTAAKKAARG